MTLLRDLADKWGPGRRRWELHLCDVFLSPINVMDRRPAGSQLGACSYPAVNINMGALVGSYGNVAALLDEVADASGCGGVLITFDDVVGVDVSGRHIQPLMRSRRHVDACATALVPAS